MNRRHTPELLRWTLRFVQDREQAQSDLSSFAKSPLAGATQGPGHGATLQVLTNRAILITLIVIEGRWFLLIIATYGNAVSQPLLIKGISPSTNNITNVAINAVLVICFALVGALAGLAVVDRVRRTTLQISGLGVVRGVDAAHHHHSRSHA